MATPGDELEPCQLSRGAVSPGAQIGNGNFGPIVHGEYGNATGVVSHLQLLKYLALLSDRPDVGQGSVNPQTVSPVCRLFQ